MVSLFSVRKAKYNLLEVKIARKIRKILNFDLQHGKSTAFSFFYFLSFSLSPPLSLPISLLFTFFSQRIVVLYFILCLCLFFLFFFCFFSLLLDFQAFVRPMPFYLFRSIPPLFLLSVCVRYCSLFWSMLPLIWSIFFFYPCHPYRFVLILSSFLISSAVSSFPSPPPSYSFLQSPTMCVIHAHELQISSVIF